MLFIKAFGFRYFTLPRQFSITEVLGVSTSEIMLGEAAACDIMHGEKRISRTVNYMEHLNCQKKPSAKDIAFISLTVSILIGIFVSGLCNYIISQKFDWSLYVFGGCIFTWIVTTPLLKIKKHALLISAAGLSVSIIPLLLLIEYLCPAKEWVLSLGLPVVLISLASLWAFLLLITLAKLKPLYLLASGLIIFGVFDNLVIQGFVANYLKLSASEQHSLSSVIVAICSGFAAVVFLIYAICAKKKK